MKSQLKSWFSTKKASFQRQICRAICQPVSSYVRTWYRFMIHPTTFSEILVANSDPPVVDERCHLSPVAFLLRTVALFSICMLTVGIASQISFVDELLTFVVSLAFAVFLATYMYLSTRRRLSFDYLCEYFCYYISSLYLLYIFTIALLLPLSTWWQAAIGSLQENDLVTKFGGFLVIWATLSAYVFIASTWGYTLGVHPMVSFRHVGGQNTVYLVAFGALWIVAAPALLITFVLWFVIPSLESLQRITD